MFEACSFFSVGGKIEIEGFFAVVVITASFLCDAFLLCFFAAEVFFGDLDCFLDLSYFF